MKVLFIGDIVGSQAAAYVADRLPGLRREHGLDLVVANAENCLVSGPRIRQGFGMGVKLIESLFEGGVDVVTSGNHAWDGPEAEAVLSHPRVLRPHNMPEGLPGRGQIVVDVHGEPVSILNLMSPSAVPEPEPVYGSYLPDGAADRYVRPVYEGWLSAQRLGTVVVDLHALAVSEKQTFAFAVDGKAAAVLGTHTHEPTVPLHLLPGGTALVTDVGMTGHTGGTEGIDPGHWVAEMKGENVDALPPFGLAGGPISLGAVLLDIEAGKTKRLERVT